MPCVTFGCILTFWNWGVSHCLEHLTITVSQADKHGLVNCYWDMGVLGYFRWHDYTTLAQSFSQQAISGTFEKDCISPTCGLETIHWHIIVRLGKCPEITVEYFFALIAKWLRLVAKTRASTRPSWEVFQMSQPLNVKYWRYFDRFISLIPSFLYKYKNAI